MAAQPKKKPGLTVAIGIGKPKADLDGPDPVDQEKGGGPGSDDEPDPQDPNEGSELECEPDPEAVCYRSVHETCQFCKYMQGENCSHPMVAQPVQPGDSCNAFKDKGEEAGQELPPSEDSDSSYADDQS